MTVDMELDGCLMWLTIADGTIAIELMNLVKYESDAEAGGDASIAVYNSYTRDDRNHNNMAIPV